MEVKTTILSEISPKEKEKHHMISVTCGIYKITQPPLVAQLVKNPPAVPKTWVQSLGWEDPLEKKTATHSRILAWRTPSTVQSVGLQ